MPYPSLLRRAVSTPARPADRYSLAQSDFPHEFAEFIDFVGAPELDNEIRKIEKRFCGKDANMRSLYRDRYFFQEQCIRFTENTPAFGLNISDPSAVRAASLIAGINFPGIAAPGHHAPSQHRLEESPSRRQRRRPVGLFRNTPDARISLMTTWPER